MDRKRNIQLKLYVDERERETIKDNMRKSNRASFSLYAREILLNGKIVVTDFKAIKNLRYEINKIGTNINQIVKLANQNSEMDKETIKEIIFLQKSIEEKINELIKINLKNI